MIVNETFSNHGRFTCVYFSRFQNFLVTRKSRGNGPINKNKRTQPSPINYNYLFKPAAAAVAAKG